MILAMVPGPSVTDYPIVPPLYHHYTTIIPPFLLVIHVLWIYIHIYIYTYIYIYMYIYIVTYSYHDSLLPSLSHTIPSFSLIFSSFFAEKTVRLEFMEGMRQLNYPASEIPQLFCDIDVEPRCQLEHGPVEIAGIYPAIRNGGSFQFVT